VVRLHGPQLEVIVAYRSEANKRDYARRHYDRNKSVYKARASAFTAKAIQRNKKCVLAYLNAHPCVDCGESDPVVLDFDHVRGVKLKEVTEMVRDGMSIANIQSEIEKCEIRCANCHRRATARRRAEGRRLKVDTAESVEKLLFD
jgi:hypothetical protein